MGDVAGKGAAAAIFMTTAQGFLHAALQEHGLPDRAMTQLNRFLTPRRPSDRFLTLWVGVLDPRARTLQYVDAGHGYAYLIDGSGGPPRQLDAGDNFPVGVADGFVYAAQTVELPDASQLVVVSDGMIEQESPPADGAVTSSQFGQENVVKVASTLCLGSDPITPLFKAVTEHAGTSVLADDTTIVVVRYASPRSPHASDLPC